MIIGSINENGEPVIKINLNLGREKEHSMQ